MLASIHTDQDITRLNYNNVQGRNIHTSSESGLAASSICSGSLGSAAFAIHNLKTIVKVLKIDIE